MTDPNDFRPMPPLNDWHQQNDAKPGVIPLRPLGLGDILGGAIATMRARPAQMVGVAAVVTAISQGIVLAVAYPMLDDINRTVTENTLPSEATELLGKTLAVIGLGLLLTLATRVFLSGFITQVVGGAVIGRPLTFAQAWKQVRPRMLPLLGLTLVYLAAALAGGLLVVMLALSGAQALPVALVIFVVVAVWLTIAFSLATPALVLENVGIAVSLRRSWHLVHRSWWRIFGITLLVWVISAVLAAIIGVPFENALVSGDVTSGNYLLMSALGAVVAGALTEPFVAAVIVLVYVDQRIRREGLADELTSMAS